MYLSIDSGYNFTPHFSYAHNSVLSPEFILKNQLYIFTDRGLENYSEAGDSCHLLGFRGIPVAFFTIDEFIYTAIDYYVLKSRKNGEVFDLFTDSPEEHKLLDIIHHNGSFIGGVENKGFLISSDGKQQYVYFNDGLPNQISVNRIQKDDKRIYIATTNGVYQRSLSDLVLKSAMGTVFHDVNKDGIQNFEEHGIPEQLLQLKKTPFTILSDSKGEFSWNYVPINDSIQYIPQQYGYSTDKTTHALSEVDETIHFPVQIDTNLINTSVSLSAFQNTRPGFETSYGVNVKNHGAGHISSDLKVYFDPILEFIPDELNQFIINNHTLSQNISLKPFESKRFKFHFSFPPLIDFLGDTIIVLTCEFAHELSDIHPLDNRDTLPVIITGSYDPNDKQVFPNSNLDSVFISNSGWLEYLIRFQNTGTDTAFNVVIEDTLDPNLQIESFHNLGSSHPYTISMDSLRLLRFSFSNIQLPDSIINEPSSHGYVRYKIKTSSSLKLGDSIQNTAYIYFDFNPAIVTNTVASEYNKKSIRSHASKILLSKQLAPLYPNPSSGKIRIPSKDVKSIQVYTQSGQLVKTEIKELENDTEINLTNHAKGIYLLKIQLTNGETYSRRISLHR